MNGSSPGCQPHGEHRAARPQPPQPSLCPPALLTAEEAAQYWGVSVRSFKELQHEDWAPVPVILGPRLLRWSRRSLDEAIERMPKVQRRAEPAELARDRIERMKSGGR